MTRNTLQVTAVTIFVSIMIGCTDPSVFSPPKLSNQPAVERLHEEIDALQQTVTRLSYNSSSGGGVNVKMMPHPETGEPTVALEEVFSFDSNHVMCRLDTNNESFKIQTHAMGEVVIDPHSFFMSMVATSIEQYTVEVDDAGLRHVTMRGGLDCATEVGQANTTLGSRKAAEHATYRVEATDGGIGGGDAGDHFAFTVFFNPEEAPINHAIFGPEFTFTGDMIAGEITITTP